MTEDELKKQSTRLNFAAMGFGMAALLQFMLGIAFIVGLRKDVDNNSTVLDAMRADMTQRQAMVLEITDIKAELRFIKSALADLKGAFSSSQK